MSTNMTVSNMSVGMSMSESSSESIDNLILCPICYGVMKNAVQCHEGHAFCEECINKWMSSHQTCPISRKSLKSCQIYPNRAIRTIVESLDILKTSQTVCTCLKCEERIPFSLMEFHRTICPNEIVDCPISSRGIKCTNHCVGKYLRKDLILHQETKEYMSLEMERLTSQVTILQTELKQTNQINLQQSLMISELNVNLRSLEKRVIEMEERDMNEERPTKRVRISSSTDNSMNPTIPPPLRYSSSSSITLTREEKEMISQITAEFKEIRDSNPTLIAKEYLFEKLQSRYGLSRAIEITTYMQLMARSRREHNTQSSNVHSVSDESNLSRSHSTLMR